MRTWLLRASFLLSFSALVGCVHSQTTPIATSTLSFATIVAEAPPPLPTAAAEEPSTPLLAWVDGHWGWRDGGYVWVDGRHVPARAGLVLVQPHWVETARGHGYVEAHWEDAHGAVIATVADPAPTRATPPADTAAGDRVALESTHPTPPTLTHRYDGPPPARCGWRTCTAPMPHVGIDLPGHERGFFGTGMGPR
jgi:hypothetical protein